LRFAAHLQRRGLAVVTGEAFATTAAPPSSIRIALGAARSQPLLLKALEILKEALNSQAREEQVVCGGRIVCSAFAILHCQLIWKFPHIESGVSPLPSADRIAHSAILLNRRRR
jgi:hypothetical protein